MTKANYGEELDRTPTSGGDTDWFKASEGSNRMRLLSNSSISAKHFSPTGYKGVCIGTKDNCKGCAEGTKASIRHLVWILDRKDDKIKLYEMPHKAFQQIAAYQRDPDWSFDEVPMPYDVNLNAKGAGTTDVVYTIIPSPKREPVSEEVATQVSQLTPTDILIEKMKDKARKDTGTASTGTMKQSEATGLPQGVEYPKEEINPSDIPF